MDRPLLLWRCSLFLPLLYQRAIAVCQAEVDAIVVTVVRTESILASVAVEYYIEPNGDAKFYGGTSVIYFTPGEAVRQVTVIAKDDGVPQVSRAVSDSSCVIFLSHLLIFTHSKVKKSVLLALSVTNQSILLKQSSTAHVPR